MYEDPQWNYSPMKAANNVNDIGKVGKHEVYTTDKEAALLAVQQAMVRKIVTELNEFDNVYYEVCNESYFGGVTQAWHDAITDVIITTEKTLPKKHLISWNVANDYAKVKDPHPAISIFNFHYARPDAVTDNYRLNKVVGLNETGFKGTGDDYYRKQAWEFLLAGGGLYNNLDYSFCVGHEDGSFPVKAPTPGGGGRELRRQLRLLSEFLRGLQFIRMRPAREVVKTRLPKEIAFQVLAEPGKQYALYFRSTKGLTLGIDLPEGKYEGEWLDAVSGRRIDIPLLDHQGGVTVLRPPEFAQDCALRLIAKEGGPRGK
jgi:hypothetical protein